MLDLAARFKTPKIIWFCPGDKRIRNRARTEAATGFALAQGSGFVLARLLGGGVACALLAIALPRQRRFHSLLFTRLQVERVALGFLDDIFLENFPFETPERALQSFAILDMYFCHSNPVSLPDRGT